MKNKILSIIVSLLITLLIFTACKNSNKYTVSKKTSTSTIEDFKNTLTESNEVQNEILNEKEIDIEINIPKDSEPVLSPKPTNSFTYGNYNLDDTKEDNSRIDWWFKRNTDFSRPSAAKTSEELSKFNTIYIGNNEKAIYLTFDEGNDTSYAAKNLDTLKKHSIKSTFFVTKPFIEKYPDLIRRMVAEGHIVANHTNTHRPMNEVLSNNPVSFIKEISDTEESFKKVTGTGMKKYFRYPSGAFSLKTLSFTKNMGYKSVFWSFAYKDWGKDYGSKEEALNWMKTYYHPGAIYLLHGVNTGNAEALDEFIIYMKSQGYEFKNIDSI